MKDLKKKWEGTFMRNVLNDCPSCIEDGKDSVEGPSMQTHPIILFYGCRKEIIPVLIA